jgi:N-acetylglutamate synthase-like GNAT family acetyltransferase
MITLHAFSAEEFGALLDLANQRNPFTPQQKAEWSDVRKAFDEYKRLSRYYLAIESGRAVGYGCIEQQGDDPSWLRIYLVGSPSDMQGEMGEQLYAQLLQDAKELKVAGLWAYELQANEIAQAFFMARGFAETERSAPPGQPPMVVYQLAFTYSP